MAARLNLPASAGGVAQVPGPKNAITDVPGVRVGHTTRIEGKGRWWEEAMANALLAAQTMTGRDGITLYGLDPYRLIDALKRHGRFRVAG